MTDKAAGTGFAGPEAARIVGISYRMLDHWCRKNLVTPSLNPAQGSGTQRRYSYEDLIELKVVKQLRDAGVSLQRIDRAFTFIREHLKDNPAGLKIMSDGNKVYAFKSDDEVIDLLNRGQVVFGFALGKIFEDLDGSLARLNDDEPGSGALADRQVAGHTRYA